MGKLIPCDSVTTYADLLITGLNSNLSAIDLLYNEDHYRWSQLFCEDYTGKEVLMECCESSFDITEKENDWMKTKDGIKTHDCIDMFAYINSELEYLGY